MVFILCYVSASFLPFYCILPKIFSNSRHTAQPPPPFRAVCAGLRPASRARTCVRARAAAPFCLFDALPLCELGSCLSCTDTVPPAGVNLMAYVLSSALHIAAHRNDMEPAPFSGFPVDIFKVPFTLLVRCQPLQILFDLLCGLLWVQLRQNMCILPDLFRCDAQQLPRRKSCFFSQVRPFSRPFCRQPRQRAPLGDALFSFLSFIFLSAGRGFRSAASPHWRARAVRQALPPRQAFPACCVRCSLP